MQQLRQLLRPLANRIANSIARGVVKLVDDEKKMQLVQLGVLTDETVDGAEYFQSYGFTSVPLEGAEAVAVFPNGDRAHPLVVAVSDRRYRPTGAQPGDVIVYGKLGGKVIMKAGGDVEIHPAPGHEVLIRDDAGSVDRVIKRSEFLAHGHATAATGPVSPPTDVLPGPDVGQFPGTQRLRVQ